MRKRKRDKGKKERKIEGGCRKKMHEIYHLFIREIERENGQGERERQRETEGYKGKTE